MSVLHHSGNISISKRGVAGSVFAIIILFLFIYYFIFKKNEDGDDTETEHHEEQGKQFVDTITYDVSWLHQPVSYYTDLANSIYQNLNQLWSENESEIMQILYPLNTQELRCVVVEFGWKDGLMFSNFSGGNLMQWLKYYAPEYYDELKPMFENAGLPY